MVVVWHADHRHIGIETDDIFCIIHGLETMYKHQYGPLNTLLVLLS